MQLNHVAKYVQQTRHRDCSLSYQMIYWFLFNLRFVQIRFSLGYAYNSILLCLLHVGQSRYTFAS